MSAPLAWCRTPFAILLALSACARPVGTTPEPVGGGVAIASEPSLPRVARSRDGMVVTGSAFATAVGAEVLARGGNAVDAAVAAAFTLGVVEPSMSGIGGRTQILLRAADGSFTGIDGTTEVPSSWPGGAGSAGENTSGYETIAVPGTVAALASAVARHGTWPLERLLAPAIRLAEHGFILPAPEAARIASVAAQLREFEGSRRYFLKPDGSPFQAGERFRQPDLARTLRAIADGGATAFYRGAIARTMAEPMASAGGHLSIMDLAAYAAEDALVVHGRYRGHDVAGTYLPASGATTIEILQILDHFDLGAYVGTPRWVGVVAQALELGFADREQELEPPRRKAEWLVSRELAELRARQVAGGRDEAQQHTSRIEGDHTTHISVADRNGMMVALTQSVGPTMGSKVAAPGLGFIYAATMGYLGETAAGERPWSSQSPLIVLRDGRPAYVVGGAGARRIISAIVQTLSRAIDQQLPLDHAMAAPRFHVTANRIDMESRSDAAWSAEDVEAVRAFGFSTRARDDPPYFARINAIAFDAIVGEWIGVADSRWDGASAGPMLSQGNAPAPRRPEAVLKDSR